MNVDESLPGSPLEENMTSRRVTGGQAVQIFSRRDGGGFELNEEKLREILLHPDVQDKPVVVISVAGAFRKGKSFLLNIFLRYMHNGEQDDWLGSASTPLEGFSWSHGAEGHTMGILVWDELFLVTREDGSQVAVLLMDTQGTFDTKATTKDCVTIFALSTLISSVQVYNLSQNIQENDLQNLQYFTEYALLAQKREGSERPFQKLVFLVRDWQHHLSVPCGKRGGTTFLHTCLNTSRPESEHQKLRDRIRSSFSEICCFLLPYPGRQVASGLSNVGCLPEMEHDFKSHLQEFVVWVLAKDNLVTKVINGEEMSCSDLFTCISEYARKFENGGLPAPESMLEAAVGFSNKRAIKKATERYKAGMKKVCGDKKTAFKNIWSLERHHNHHLKAALKVFASSKKMGGKPYSDQYEALLRKEIDEIFKAFAEENKQKMCIGTPIVLSVPMALSVGGAAAVATVVGGPIGLAAVAAAIVIGGASAGTLAAWGVSRKTGKIAAFREKLDSIVDVSLRTMVGLKEKFEDFEMPTQRDLNSRNECRDKAPKNVETTWTPVIRAKDDHSFEFDEVALKRILLADHVKDMPVVVVSVAGPFGKGKCFLLDIFIRYMRSRGQTGWLNYSKVYQGRLKQRVSGEHDTTGILLLDEIFVVTTTQGQQLAVLFMLTQGPFDGGLAMRDCTRLFALSAMTSSVQIYNLSQNITENDLRHLQLLTDEYETLVEQGKSEKPYQKLLFLVRDWSSSYQARYGSVDGSIISDSLLQTSEGHPQEFQHLWERIRSCFTQISLFLMPHPGPKVASATSLSDINDGFKKQLQELVPSLLAPDKLLVKQINGETVTCQQLLNYFELYANKVLEDERQEESSPLEVEDEANDLVGTNGATDNGYTSDLEQLSDEDEPSSRPDMIENHSQQLQGSAAEWFSPSSGDPEEDFSQPNLNRLTQEAHLTDWSVASREERGEVLAVVRTPVTLCTVGLAFYLVSWGFSVIGVEAFASVCNLFFGMSLLSLGLWGYGHYTGHMGEVLVEIDAFVNIIWGRLLEPIYKSMMQASHLMPHLTRNACEDCREPPIFRLNSS